MKLGDGTQAAIIGAISGFIVASIGYAVTFGELKGDVKALTERVKSKETRSLMNPNEVKKGTLCLELMKSLTESYTSSLSSQADNITAQLEKFGCYDVSAATAPIDEEATKK